MWKHLKSIFLFFFYHQEADFHSDHSISESVSRISAIVGEGSVSIGGRIQSNRVTLWKDRRGSYHRGGAPIAPVFTGEFSKEDDSVALIGQFEIEPFTKWCVNILVVGVGFLLCQSLLFTFLRNSYAGTHPVKVVIGLALLISLLEAAFWQGRKDITYISQEIRNALGTNS